MVTSKWFLHPILIFIASIVALGSSLILYIYWYMEVSEGLNSVVQRFNLDAGQILTAQTWVVIMVLSILVGLILMGLFLIFAYSQKMVQLYRLQHNFINNFTHELKTPAASLQLYLETFQKYELERGEQLKYLEYMLADVNRLSGTISRILNLARIESNSFSAEFAWLDPMATIEHFLEKNEPLFAGCRIGVVNGAGKVDCRIYPALFDILLMNLITNAMKYNDADQPQIDIRAKALPNKIQIDFCDNGIGFDHRERNRIFKKFYQIGRSEDMSAKGSGIGLYLAQNIAKKHKGKLRANSPGMGKGAVFTLILPVYKQKGRVPK